MTSSRRFALCVCVIALWVFGFETSRLGAQIATFSSKLEVVRVDALVTESGRIVSGLQPRDFEVRDNGVVQQVDLASFEELPLNVILALDASDSLSGDRLEHFRNAVRSVIEVLESDDRAALLTFTHIVALREGLTGDTARMRTALDGLEAGGETSLVDGAYAAMILAEPEGARRNLVIIFSDGHDTSSWLLPDRVLDSARRSDATIYAVSVRTPRPTDFLRDLTTLSGGSVVEVESTKDLSATFIRILDEFRQRYVISYTPRGVARSGFHRLQVRVKGRRTEVRARGGYFGE